MMLTRIAPAPSETGWQCPACDKVAPTLNAACFGCGLAYDKGLATCTVCNTIIETYEQWFEEECQGRAEGHLTDYWPLLPRRNDP